MAKSCQLMAWTHKGQVRMVPSLVAEMAEPFVRRIQAAEDEPAARDEDGKIEQLLRRSRAYESLARYFQSVGYWQDAFIHYVKSATMLTVCTDHAWIDTDEGFLLCQPLESRFFSVYGKCTRLCDEHPALKGSLQWQTLQERHAAVTSVYRIWHAEEKR